MKKQQVISKFVGSSIRGIALAAAAAAVAAFAIVFAPAPGASADHGYEFNSGGGGYAPNGVLCGPGRISVNGPFVSQRAGSFGDLVNYAPWLEKWVNGKWVPIVEGNRSSSVLVYSSGKALPNQAPAFNINSPGYYRIGYNLRWGMGPGGGTFAGLAFLSSAYVPNNNATKYFYEQNGRAVAANTAWCQFT